MLRYSDTCICAASADEHLALREARSSPALLGGSGWHV